ncbi:MAG: phosphopyruvate hydratase [Candidatus Micrarchaeia archaeon]
MVKILSYLKAVKVFRLNINCVSGRMIFDSRGNPTVEATVCAGNFTGTAAAPSGASTGTYEAVELRDGGKEYNGKGVSKALNNINIIENAIRGMDVLDQKSIDKKIIELDGTGNKSKLGANATVAVSMAVARSAAASEGKELFMYLNPSADRLPIPFMNVINGGKHAGSGLAVQEFMIVPVNARNFTDAMRMCTEVYHELKEIISDKYGKSATGVGDEGGFAPAINKTSDALDLIMKAIEKTGYMKEMRISLDCAASEFYDKGMYRIDGKKIGTDKLLDFYADIVKEYNLFSIEDPFNEDDFEAFSKLIEYVKCKVVGDDLTVTNVSRIQKAIDMKSINTLLLKVNQIGTLTEAWDAATLALNNNCGVIVSHRSGETCDTFIADLAVALNCGMIKSGAPCRSERVEKYNRLLKIEEILGTKAKYGIEVM